MYILATKSNDKDSHVKYEDFTEFKSLSELKDYVVRTQAECMVDAALAGYDVEVDRLTSRHHIYKQVPMDEAEIQELEESLFNALPKQLTNLAVELSKRQLKVVA